MAYISATDDAILKINVGRIFDDSSLIKGIIARDKNSVEKAAMRVGVAYYDGEHEILTKDFRVYHVKKTKRINENKANNRVPNTFHTELVDSKASYIAGKKITLNSKNTDLDIEFKKKEFREKLDTTIHELCINCSNKGVEWIHFFINESGQFNYLITPAEQIIPDYNENNILQSLMRYYPVDFINEKGELKQKTRVEIWDDKQVTFYIETEKGDFIKDLSEDINPRPHWLEKRIVGNIVTEKNAKSWGVVPFLSISNNTKNFTDLKRIKASIDLYDLVISAFGNVVQDSDEIIIKVKNYDGQDNEEMAQMIRETKIIKVSGDGDADALTLTIPVEAKNTLLKILKENVYNLGRGIDYSGLSLSNPTNMTLTFMFARLDLKANPLINSLEGFIKRFLFYYCFFLGKESLYKIEDIEIIFNRSIIINETEKIQNCIASVGILSEETILENHPWVADVKKEIERKNMQRENIVDPNSVVI